MNVCTCYPIRVRWTATKCKSPVFLILNQLMWAKLSYCGSLSFSDTRCKHTNSCFAFLSTVILKEFSLVFALFCCVNSLVHVQFVFDGAVVIYLQQDTPACVHTLPIFQLFKFFMPCLFFKIKDVEKVHSALIIKNRMSAGGRGVLNMRQNLVITTLSYR